MTSPYRYRASGARHGPGWTANAVYSHREFTMKEPPQKPNQLFFISK
ncbi:hypothetical protein BURPS406E_C1774 [Burkholderia pseudomallei 406e]|uniref:Uncharacterized protein n=1 Tax=Burkholderia pseudomallei (strain 1106a) TaxID=357348 RepID=A3P697_BURP0|nr:hypothetical protein BURPS668_A1910 [Burkholderia pseudomallei 668]ABN93250.1 hypothetical protein BURPS1106A_A1823 [Burkholderia pseudomallei 1106a]EBA46296.1 hypothetical protein BURPS305_1626 [Burkholderia pseudomallei 305]EDO88910.1 hypothetical protein BURPS406E_C1774 [Burkholderia pseudomallei 406e]EDO94547.1 hypothetical protein BURPSPAST_V0207 [Burkholderia pseudomallei Pasteur 52237]EEH25457.1 conserved hypothetical protein [Burkholderia pseudomallei Pakistan 9]EEP50737.1 conserve